MIRRGIFLFILLLTAMPAVAQTRDVVITGQTEKRVALIIGNAAYKNATPLVNPTNDARLMAKTLAGVGFQLIGGKPLIDADRPAIERAIRDFGNALRGGAVGLFYYSGHGVQVNGANYIIPVTANITQESDIKYELVDVGFVLDEMANAGNRLNIVILDACRNNPFGGRGLRAVSSGLAQVSAPAGTVISYATQPGNVASDGTGGNSPYTTALAAAIRMPSLDVFATFNTVGLKVKQSTSGQQQPWLATSPIEGQFYFAGLTNQGGAGSSGAGSNDELTRLRAEMEALKAQANKLPEQQTTLLNLNPNPVPTANSAALIQQEMGVYEDNARTQARTLLPPGADRIVLEDFMAQRSERTRLLAASDSAIGTLSMALEEKTPIDPRLASQVVTQYRQGSAAAAIFIYDMKKAEVKAMDLFVKFAADPEMANAARQDFAGWRTLIDAFGTLNLNEVEAAVTAAAQDGNSYARSQLIEFYEEKAQRAPSQKNWDYAEALAAKFPVPNRKDLVRIKDTRQYYCKPKVCS